MQVLIPMQVQVEDCKVGAYRVSYVPSHEGNYLLLIRVREQHIFDSPFLHTVMPFEDDTISDVCVPATFQYYFAPGRYTRYMNGCSPRARWTYFVFVVRLLLDFCGVSFDTVVVWAGSKEPRLSNEGRSSQGLRPAMVDCAGPDRHANTTEFICH